MNNRLLAALLLSASASLAFVGVVEAQQQPVQWNYSFTTGGVAQATYPGNVNVLGSISGVSSPATSPTVFGADPTGVTDATSAFGSAINTANVNPTFYNNRVGTFPPNASVFCPQSTIYKVSGQLLFPAGVNFGGNGAYNSCQIFLNSTNATIQATGLVSLQANGGAASDFGHRADDMTLNMNLLSGVGFYCASCQDHSGFSDDWVYNINQGPCFFMDGTQPGGSTNTFRFSSDECWGSATRTAGGDGMLFKIGTYPPDIQLPDVLSFTGHLFTNFLHFNQMLNATVENVTCEDSGGASDGNTSSCVLVDGPMATGHIDGVSSQYVGNVVTLNPSGTASMELSAIYRVVGGTNTIVNTSNFCGPPQTVTDVFVPLYVCSNLGIYLNGTDVHVGPEVSYNATKLQVTPDSNANPALMQFYSAAGATGAALRNGIQMWDLSNNGWNMYNFGDGADMLNFDSVAGGAATTRIQFQYPQGAIKANGGIIAGGSVPTASGTCTHASQVGGNTAGTIALTCTAQTLTLTFAQTAPNGWTCTFHDRATPADSPLEASSTTTSWTSGSTTTGAADVNSFVCNAF